MAARKRRRSTKRKSIPTNKALYPRVKAAAKRKFAVYPSAYANAWLVREYKKRGGKYRSDNIMCIIVNVNVKTAIVPIAIVEIVMNNAAP